MSLKGFIPIALMLLMAMPTCYAASVDASSLSDRFDEDAVELAAQSQASATLQDSRPDLFVNPTDVYTSRNGANTSEGMSGMEFQIHAKVQNIGESPANDVWVLIGFRDVTGFPNLTLFQQAYSSLDSNTTGDAIDLVIDWRLGTFLPGEFELWVVVDAMNLVNETNEANNLVALEFTILPLLTDITVITDKLEYSPEDDLVIVTAAIYYAGTTDPAFVLLSFYLVDPYGDIVPDTETSQITSDYYGSAATAIYIPPGTEDGVYHIGVKVFDEPWESPTTIHISRPDPKTILVEALAFALLIIAAVVGLLVLVLRFIHRR